MSAHDTVVGALSSGPAGHAAAGAAAWGVVPGPVPAPVSMQGDGLTMLGPVDGSDPCADGSCAIAIVDPAG